MSGLELTNPRFKDGRVLTREQLEFYDKNGFILIKNCVPQADLKRFNKRFLEISEGKNVHPQITVMKGDWKDKGNIEFVVEKLQDFNVDPVLFDYCKHPHVVEVVEDLIGGDNDRIMAMHTMLINKPPDTGSLKSRHPMHQDQLYFPFGPENFICCGWTAMEKVTKENGCLVVVPGTHKTTGKLLPHKYPDWEGGVNKAYYGVHDYDPSQARVHVEMEAGDTVFFHPLLLHGSGANRSQGSRRAISCHYANGSRCHYFDVAGTPAEELAKEVVDMNKKRAKRMGLESNLTFIDIWKNSGRCVNGQRAHL
ncbi:unnamed protein product [Bursaphelenchus xylophilus]|uniref:phytanoyl-CoA dioxygenase n=1 Tax=Bursaphelenchus xylophilus TaxID=6326 RepID=A0A1I7RW87_BURXY|nr:unnamed protein product [Bursaphelenchus xylophilus]CAG9095277.1 unnamed protein product [Bursaphelenchus xylophilus]